MSRIRPRRMTGREEVWARYAFMRGLDVAADAAKRIEANEPDPVIRGTLRSLAHGIRAASAMEGRKVRNGSRLRLRGAR